MTITCAPSSTSRRAPASPIPFVPPVMSTRLPLNFAMIQVSHTNI
ncbi:hypothetical protein [Brachybacterium sacelli]